MNFLRVISYIPLFLIMLLLYHTMVVVGINFVNPEPLFSFFLPSGAEWAFSSSDIFIMVGVIVLYIEIVKSTRTGTGTVVEHGLSIVVFILYLLDFMLIKQAGTSAFLIITLMSLLDVIAGFTITVASARRDFAMGG